MQYILNLCITINNHCQRDVAARAPRHMDALGRTALLPSPGPSQAPGWGSVTVREDRQQEMGIRLIIFVNGGRGNNGNVIFYKYHKVKHNIVYTPLWAHLSTQTKHILKGPIPYRSLAMMLCGSSTRSEFTLSFSLFRFVVRN